MSRFVIYALRRIGLTADDRGAIPLIYESHRLHGQIRHRGELVPAEVVLETEPTDVARTAVRISVDEPTVAAQTQRILDGYRPEDDPELWTTELRMADEEVRQRRLRETGWMGQPTMPSDALDVVMEGFDEPTEDPVARDIWLQMLWGVRLAKSDRGRLVPWLLDRSTMRTAPMPTSGDPRACSTSSSDGGIGTVECIHLVPSNETVRLRCQTPRSLRRGHVKVSADYRGSQTRAVEERVELVAEVGASIDGRRGGAVARLGPRDIHHRSVVLIVCPTFDRLERSLILGVIREQR